LRWKKLYVAHTGNGTGKGIFAKVDIKKGDVIFVWKGQKKSGRSYPWDWGSRWLQVGQYEWIAPMRNTPGWYINHSCNPNSGIKDSIKIVAMKNIRRGEEVTIDYSTFESEKGWYLECQCKSKNCRHIIRSYEFLPPKLRQKYSDFISEYLK
jgi:hypothetical protein